MQGPEPAAGRTLNPVDDLVEPALIEIATPASGAPLGCTPWLCETTAAEVRFARARARGAGPRRFSRAVFAIEGRFPRPAD